MNIAAMRSPETSAPAHRDTRERMGDNLVMPGAMIPSRRLSTERRATTRRRSLCMARLITDRVSIMVMVRAGVGEDDGGNGGFVPASRHKPSYAAFARYKYAAIPPSRKCCLQKPSQPNLQIRASGNIYRCTPSAADSPPSTGSTAPVTYDAPGDIRNATTDAISSGVAKRRAGIWPSMVSRNFA